MILKRFVLCYQCGYDYVLIKLIVLYIKQQVCALVCVCVLIKLQVTSAYMTIHTLLA